MPSTTIKYFAFAHLPPKLQAVSKPLGELAEKLEALLPDGPEKSPGMRGCVVAAGAAHVFSPSLALAAVIAFFAASMVAS